MTTYLTKVGFDKVKSELANVLSENLPNAKKRYEDAKMYGFTKGSADFDERKEIYDFFKRRVVVLQDMLDNAQLIIGKEETK